MLFLIYTTNNKTMVLAGVKGFTYKGHFVIELELESLATDAHRSQFANAGGVVNPKGDRVTIGFDALEILPLPTTETDFPPSLHSSHSVN